MQCVTTTTSAFVGGALLIAVGLGLLDDWRQLWWYKLVTAVKGVAAFVRAAARAVQWSWKRLRAMSACHDIAVLGILQCFGGDSGLFFDDDGGGSCSWSGERIR